MQVPLDRDNPTPLYQQIEAFLRKQICSGGLEAGTRLPATRDLAESLGVSRVTVSNAYGDLEAEGLLAGRTGSGTYVATQARPPARTPRDTVGADDWPQWQQRLLSSTWLSAQRSLDQLTDTSAHPNPISLAGGLGASDLFPVDDFRKALQTVWRRDGVDAVGYGEREGYPPLRATIAHILSSQGVPTHPGDVLITSGSQQALSLVAHLLLRPGDVVLVESPTYSGAIDLFRSMEVRLMGIPMDDQGMQVDRLEEAMSTASPRLLYTIPTFHNPTGVCLNGARRRQLLAVADRYNVPILEDDFVSDLRYEGRSQPALRSLDPGGRVIYVSTFSKMLMPGLRVGFLTASGPVYESLLAYKRATDLASSSLLQRALEAYITVGRYQSHLRKACHAYRRRRDAMLASLTRHLPAGASWGVPAGGLFLWLRLPEGMSSNELFPVAVKEGLIFTPGSIFFPGERAQPYLRLNFAMNSPEVIEEGIRRLAKAIERCLAGARKAHREPSRRHVAV